MPSQRIEVHLLPTLVSPSSFSSKAAVAVDVLRATTTIVTAMAEGARSVLPCLEVDEARDQANRMPACLLGGERGGERIEGFDLGNSPGEYTAERVLGKSIVFTTTNGTRAIQRCAAADSVVVGAFVNLEALSLRLESSPAIAILCAGTAGEVSREDTLFAGALVDRLCRDGDAQLQLNDSARLALAAWQQVGSAESLVDCLRQSRGGCNLERIGLGDDIEVAAQLSRYACIPEMNEDGVLVAK